MSSRRRYPTPPGDTRVRVRRPRPSLSPPTRASKAPHSLQPIVRRPMPRCRAHEPVETHSIDSLVRHPSTVVQVWSPTWRIRSAGREGRRRSLVTKAVQPSARAAASCSASGARTRVTARSCAAARSRTDKRYELRDKPSLRPLSRLTLGGSARQLASWKRWSNIGTTNAGTTKHGSG